MVRFSNVTESTGSNHLDIGKHLVKITDAKNTTKDGTLMTDDSGVEIWSVTFEDSKGFKHYEYFRFSGGIANKTGFMFRAIRLLADNEKISECETEFEPLDIVGKYLYIEIEKNEKAKNGKQIKFTGFEKYDGKAKAKKQEEEETEFPF